MLSSIIVNEWQDAKHIIKGPNSNSGKESTAESNLFLSLLTGTTSAKLKSSSVRVPVLSKQTQLIQPLILIERGDMQNIWDRRSRDWAKTTPIYQN